MGYVSKVFNNEHEHRLRAFWRLLIQAILYVVFSVSTGAVAVIAVAWVREISVRGANLADPDPAAERMLTNAPSTEMTVAVVTGLGVLISVWLATHLLDRRSFFDLGLHLNRGWWVDLGFGMALGALLMGGVFLTQWAAGWIEVVGTFQTAEPGQPFVMAIVLPVILYISVGVSEEILSRGYQLKNMAEGLNFAVWGPRGAILLAVLISSSVFGLLHLGNPNTTALSTINIAVAGFLFAAGYVLTGKLAISIGLHITWNLLQGNVFGFPVSGARWIETTFIEIEQGGPQLWTGGAFGPEGGLLDPIASFVGMMLIIAWVRYRYGRVSLEVALAQPPERRARSLPAEAKGS